MRLSDIVRHITNLFEKKRKNPIQLETDSNLESNLKFLKVSNKSTPIQISEDTVNISGTLNVNGSAVQTGTDAGATELDGLSDVTYSSGDLTITSLDKIISGSLEFDCSGDITMDAAGGDIVLSSADIKIDAAKKLYFDGGGNTYIYEASACLLRFYVGSVLMFEMREDTATGDLANFGSSAVGFTQFEPTYIAADTDVNFKHKGNKAHLTFGSGNITDLNLNFPNVSCNCILLVTQDGTGSRTITNYKTFDQIAGNESTVLFAGGSNPTLTTTADKTDIISFYWDNDNHIAYATITYNF